MENIAVEPEGLSGDRRWLVVDAHGQFLSQRSHPVLAQLCVQSRERGLTLSFGADQLDVDCPTGSRTDVVIWRDRVNAVLCPEPVNRWLSTKLDDDVRLVVMDAQARRMKTVFDRDDRLSVSFADGYPVLITQTASLEALNAYVKRQGEAPLTMARFRPNIVIDGGTPWALDGYARLRMGGIDFDLIKPCTRCIMTTLDPATGESRGPAALNALTVLRKSGDKRVKGVLFGWNAVARQTGRLSVGDAVSVLKTRPAWPVVKAV